MALLDRSQKPESEFLRELELALARSPHYRHAREMGQLAQTGQSRDALLGHKDEVHALSFSNDGHWLASAGEREVRLWDLTAPMEERVTLGHDFPGRVADGGRNLRNTHASV